MPQPKIVFNLFTRTPDTAIHFEAIHRCLFVKFESDDRRDAINISKTEYEFRIDSELCRKSEEEQQEKMVVFVIWSP